MESTVNKGNNKGKRGRVENLKPFVKGDPRINRKGAPKRAISLSGAFDDLLNKTAEEAAALFGGKANELGRFFLQLPKGIELRYIVSGRNLTAEISEPNSRRLATIFDRLEGKVAQPITGDGSNPLLIEVTLKKKDEL